MIPPPTHVLAAFGVPHTEPVPAPELGDLAWRADDAVLAPVGNAAEAAWAAQTLDGLQADGVRLSRPLRSSDGRWVVAGWAASKFQSGVPEPRHDEVVAVSLRLHQATARLARPRFLDGRRGVLASAEQAAWGDNAVELAPERGGADFGRLAGARRRIELRDQVVHGDLFGNVLFAGAAPPAVLGFTPFWRPVEWAAAVVVVDALAWGGSDDGLPHRWTELAEWPQVLLRALLFRLALHAQHPRSTPQSLAGLQRSARVVATLL